MLDALHPTYCAGHLSNQGVTRVRSALDATGVDVRHHLKLRILKRNAFQGICQVLLRGLHQRTVERRAYRQHDRALRPGFFAQRRGAFHRFFAARDDNLIR